MECNSGSMQRWNINATNGTSLLNLQDSDKCMEYDVRSKHVEVNDCFPDIHTQRWIFSGLELTTEDRGHCLSYKAKSSDGIVSLQKCNGKSYQQWHFEREATTMPPSTTGTPPPASLR